MEVLVAYDVSTESDDGKRRLRRVAKICEAHGQRVQKSVFECIVSAAELEVLKHRLAGTIEEKEDSLRIYRLSEPRQKFLYVLGVKPAHDLHDPLVL